MHSLLQVVPSTSPPLHHSFRPAVLGNRAFRRAVRESGRGMPLRLALQRGDDSISVFETEVFAAGTPGAEANVDYVERLLKFLLWQRGGWRVVVGGAPEIAAALREIYSPDGARAFDAAFMGVTVFERPFTVESCALDEVPEAREATRTIGRHLKGCRVGFDLGASDRKTSAVVDGEDVFSEEVPWDPRNAVDWHYHYDGIRHSIQRAVDHLPRLDAIGGSAAGVYVDNRAMVASLFRGIPQVDFERHVKPLFLRLGEEFGVPLVVVNDGEVTALAGSMSLEANAVLGVAMGSSEAAGYVTPDGTITDWLNELAFAPIDHGADAPVDEWSGDVGCGVQYFSQQGVMRLAARAGLSFDLEATVPERLEQVQAWGVESPESVLPLYRSIGICLGYGLAHYADFYAVEKLLVLGRVTTGAGGDVILDEARCVLEGEFPEVAERVEMMLPSEKLRRVGQAIAAASLPALAGA